MDDDTDVTIEETLEDRDETLSPNDVPCTPTKKAGFAGWPCSSIGWSLGRSCLCSPKTTEVARYRPQVSASSETGPRDFVRDLRCERKAVHAR